MILSPEVSGDSRQSGQVRNDKDHDILKPLSMNIKYYEDADKAVARLVIMSSNNNS